MASVVDGVSVIGGPSVVDGPGQTPQTKWREPQAVSHVPGTSAPDAAGWIFQGLEEGGHVPTAGSWGSHAGYHGKMLPEGEDGVVAAGGDGLSAHEVMEQFGLADTADLAALEATRAPEISF